jgi:hypothetical protein
MHDLKYFTNCKIKVNHLHKKEPVRWAIFKLLASIFPKVANNIKIANILCGFWLFFYTTYWIILLGKDVISYIHLIKPISYALVYKMQKCHSTKYRKFSHSKEKSYVLILQYIQNQNTLAHEWLNHKLTKLSTRLTIISVKPEQNTHKNAFCRSHRVSESTYNNQLRAVGRHGNRAAKQFGPSGRW